MTVRDIVTTTTTMTSSSARQGHDVGDAAQPQPRSSSDHNNSGDDDADASLHKSARRCAYAAAADPRMYRVADRVLYACAAHDAAVVLCCTAGKTGRCRRRRLPPQQGSYTAARGCHAQHNDNDEDDNENTLASADANDDDNDNNTHSKRSRGHAPARAVAAVGATLLWLTCPYLNAFVARVELHGGVRVASQCVRDMAVARAAHARAHDAYARLAHTLLTPSQWQFFRTHFVDAADAKVTAADATSSSLLPASGRRYGNAAVGHADDVKCLHALVAQSLAGAPSPVGVAVLNYLLFLHDMLPHTSPATTSNTHDERCDDDDGDDDRLQARTAALRAALDSVTLLERFLRCALTDDRLHAHDGDGSAHGDAVVRLVIDVPELDVCTRSSNSNDDGSNKQTSTQRTHMYCDVQAMQRLRPDLCQCACDVLSFAHGHAPHATRKRRRN